MKRLLVLAVVCAAACSEAPLAPTPDTSLLAKVPGSKAFNNVIVRPAKGNGKKKNNGPVVDNLADALTIVADGGTIRVHPGRYVTHDVPVDKAVRIRGKPGAEIVNETGSTSLSIGGGDGGDVLIEGLAFTNEAPSSGGFFDQTASIDLAPGFGHVAIEESIFSSSPGNGILIFQRADNPAPSPSLTLKDNHFAGGARVLRLSAQAPSLALIEVDIEGNDFSESTDQALALFGATGSVSKNDFTRCGSWCVRAATGTGPLDVVENRFNSCTANTTASLKGCVQMSVMDVGLVADNEFSNRENGGFSLFLFGSTPDDANYVAEDNMFDGCGSGSCIVTDGQTAATIRGNELTGYGEDRTEFGIISSGLSGPGNDIIEGNVITGLNVPGGDIPNDNTAYGFDFGGIFVNGGSTAMVSRNQVSGTLFGVWITDFGVANGSNNVITGVSHPIGFQGGGTTNITRSDFDWLVTPLFVDDPADAAGDLRCNWWGSAAGPDFAGDPPPATIVVTPFATSPIAGDPTVSCDPGP